MKKFIKILLLTIFTLFLSACSVIFEEREPRPIEPLTQEEAKGKSKVDESIVNNDSPATDIDDKNVTYPYTIKTNDGKEIIIEKIPERILSLSDSSTEIVLALDNMDRIIGGFGMENYQDKINLDRKNPNLIGEVIENKPDLIFFDSQVPEYIISKWEEKGIHCLMIKGDKLEDILNNIKIIGTLSGSKGKAESMVYAFDKRVKKVESEKKEGKIANVFIELDTKPLTSIGKNTILNDALTIAGGKNIVENLEGKGQVNSELIKRSQIDAYIILSNEKNRAEKEESLLNLEESKKENIKKIYLLDVEKPESPSIDYFDIVEELKGIIDDSLED